MIRPFNFRGYVGSDPLDHVSKARRTALAMGVTAILSVVLVFLISSVFHVVEFIGTWFEVFEIAGYALIAAPIVLGLRKSSSVVTYGVVVLPLVLTDLYLQAQYRDQGLRALWDYPAGTVATLVTVHPVQFLITISVDAVLIGPVCLWLARLLAVRFSNAAAASEAPTEDQRDALFPEEWTLEKVGRPSRDAAYWILRLLGFGYASYLFLLALGGLGSSSWPGPIRSLIDMTYSNPIFALSTYSKISFMVFFAFLGAYNARVRWYAALVLAAGHGVSTASSMLFYAIDEPSPARDFLLVSAIVDGVMIVLFVYVMIASAPRRYRFVEEKDFPSLFSVPARLARWLYAGLAVLSLLVMAFILAGRLAGFAGGAPGALLAGPDPMIGNTLTMFGVIALVAFMVTKRERLREYLVGVITTGVMAMVLPGVLWLLFAPVVVRPGSGLPVPVEGYVAGYLLAISVIACTIGAVRRMYYNVEYTVTAFSPSSACNIMALHDTLFEGEEDHRGDVLQSIDRYAGTIRGRKRGLLNFPFWLIEDVFPAVFGFHPPFSVQSAEERKYFLRKYLVRLPRERAKSMVPVLAEFAYAMGVAAHSVLIFASYSYIKKQYRIRYVPPGARDRLQRPNVTSPPPFREIAPLPVDESDRANFERPNPLSRQRTVAPRVTTPVNEPRIPEEVDFLVVGSGPGGAVMAYRLACGADRRRVLLVERGGRYSPLQDFNDREIEMMPKLYKEGGLQQTKRADMTVLQGECVGGGSVINNAICYEMPERINLLWREKYNIDVDALAAEYDRTAEELDIAPLTETSLNQVVKAKFLKGVNRLNLGLPKGERLSVVQAASANALHAMGDGLWNIGNKYMRKRSMLETYIPWGESAGRKGGDAKEEPPGMQVVSNTTAVRFLHDGHRATDVILRTATGDLKTVRVRKAVVAACGVIASSHFLLRSGVTRNVGRRMSCNFAFPMAFEFGERVAAFDGEQITMGAIDPANRAIFETYFNPPSAFALSIPFFFGRHRRVMLDYATVLNFGTLVGSEPNGAVERSADLVNGQAFSWWLGETDRVHIRYALTTLLRIGMNAGAKRAVIPTQPGIEFDVTPHNVEKFAKAIGGYPLRMQDLMLTTAHPQGGNLMAGSKAAAEALDQRVVDERFRAIGFDNVFVADASVFPTSLTINPQWTIMAMSSLASRSVLDLCG